ncbi:hypothetical protein VQH23_26260 (plasmid) [Pararoseomonas sp. SCSIO 73927]|uniref:hypothetical protein n=1 Tax=Pararoseomonas sp. SCSIO 73927 TaxID=3114537 RepID=UPI0030D526B3
MFRSKKMKATGTLALAAAMFAPFVATTASAEGYYPQQVFQTQVMSRSDVQPHTHEDHYRPRPQDLPYAGMQGAKQTFLEQSGATGGGGQGQ